MGQDRKGIDWVERVVGWSLRRATWILIATLAMTMVFGFFIQDIRLDNDVNTLVPDDEAGRLYFAAEELYGSPERMFVGVFRDGSIFHPETLVLVQRLSDAVAAVEGVDAEGLLSLSATDDIRASDFGIELRPLMTEVPATPAAMEELRERVMGNDMVLGSIVSGDETATAIVARLGPHADRQEVYRQVAATVEAEEATARETGAADRLSVAGEPMVYALISDSTMEDLLGLTPLALLAVSLVLFLAFRKARGVLVPLLVILVSIVWTVGLMALLDQPITMIGTAMPVMLIAIGAADGIHVIAEYLRMVAAGDRKEQAIRKIFRHLTLPIVMTSVTTMAGFASLLTSTTPSIRIFGIFTAFGIFVAMLVSLLALPALLRFLPATHAPVAGGGGQLPQGLLGEPEGLFARWGRAMYTHRLRVVVAAGLLLVLAVYGTSRVNVDHILVEYFPEESPIRQADTLINERLGGTATFNILVDTGEVDGVKDPRVLQAVAGLQEHLAEDPMVGFTVSLSNVVARTNRAVNGGDPAFDRVPGVVETVYDIDWIVDDQGREQEVEVAVEVPGREQVAQYLLLYEGAGGDQLWEMVDPDFRQLNIIAQVRSTRIDDLRRVRERTEDYVAGHFDDHWQAGVASVDYAGANVHLVMNDSVMWGQVRSLATAVALILVIISLMFRSAVAGILAVAPLTLTILLNFTAMSWTGVYLEVGTALVGSIAMGIGIDYSIHVLSRYRRRIQETGDAAGSSAHAVASSGRAVFFNALAVAVGFSVLVGSSFIPVRNIGWLVALTMLVSAAGAVTLLPAALNLLRPGFVTRGASAGPGERAPAGGE